MSVSFHLSTLFVAVYSLNKVNDPTGSLETTQEIYDQTLDHFNAYNQATFKQRWFWNDTYWSGASKLGPFIFQAGGEGQNNGGLVLFILT